MRHKRAGRGLGRNATHRQALFRNLARALFTHGRIITTLPKAKEVRPFVEKLITLAKKGDLHHRRLAISRLHDEEIVTKLFAEIGPRFKDRPGGYTRIIKRPQRRLGDAGVTAYLELLKEGETRTRTRATPAPAPQVRPATPPAPEPKPEEPRAQEPAPTPPTAEPPAPTPPAQP
jgi:large subunit ribosomal protein L17